MTAETTLDLNISDMVVSGVLIGGLGDAAGIQPGDRITAVNGASVSNSSQIRSVLDALAETSSLTFGVVRQGRAQDLGPVPLSASLKGGDAPARTRSDGHVKRHLGVRHGDAGIILTTAPAVPGQKILSVLGLVFGVGTAAWSVAGTSSNADSALGKASEDLVREARMLGADAVISVTFSMDGAGTVLGRSQTITLLGTAVVLEPHAPDPTVGASGRDQP